MVRVESDRFPYLPVRLSLHGRKTEFEALLDTGFDGGLAASESAVANVQAAEWNLTVCLADGTLVNVPAFLGTVQVGKLPPVNTTVITLGDEPIIGRAVADQHSTTLDHSQRIVVGDK